MLRQKTVYYSLGFPFNIIEHPATSQEARGFRVSAHNELGQFKIDIMTFSQKQIINTFAGFLPINGRFSGGDLADVIYSSFFTVSALSKASEIREWDGVIIRKGGKTFLERASSWNTLSHTPPSSSSHPL